MRILFLILLFVVGSVFGSFLCCQARRMHLKECKKGKSLKSLGSRSICLNCHYQLKWYDNIPLFSWLFLRGKCRKCYKQIGIAEFLSELGMGMAFLALGTTISLQTTDFLSWAVFVFTLVLMLCLGFLAIYDGLYGELPAKYLYISLLFALIVSILKACTFVAVSGFSASIILDPIASVGILGGVYFVLYTVSKGRWVGDGDWILGTALGLAISSPWLALIALFVANVLACLVMAPTAKKSKSKQIYFGPFMVIAFVIVIAFANFFYYAIGT